MNYLKSYYLFWLWLAAISLVTLGSLLPITHVPDTSGLVTDKIQHALAYALLGVLALICAKTREVKLFLLILTCAVGVLIEFLQPLTGRYFELNDIVANSFGIIMALILYYLGRVMNSHHQIKNTKK